MKKELVGILIVMLFMTTAILPATAYNKSNEIINEKDNTPNLEKTYVVEWIVGVLYKCLEFDYYYIVYPLISFSFIFGVEDDRPIFSPWIGTSIGRTIIKEEFTGTITERTIVGKIVYYHDY